jgi:hypothetical protein
MAKGEFGFSQLEFDHAMFWRASQGSGVVDIYWEGKGKAGSTPASVYLKRMGTPYPSQAIYVPAGMMGKCDVWGCIVDLTTPDYGIVNQAVATTGFFRTAAGGNLTLEGSGALTCTGLAAAPTLTITANTDSDVQGFELILADADTADITYYVKVHMRIHVLDITTEGLGHLPSGGTAALTDDEDPIVKLATA